jgi:hypothetical protein
MSVSAVAPLPVSANYAESLVPRLPSENAATADGGEQRHLQMFADDDNTPSFGDLLDVINPLQHIPIVNDIYREATGDKIGVGARLAGGALFGGPLGLVAAAINCVVEEATGHDIGGHAIALFKGEGGDGATAVAQAAPAKTEATAPAKTEATARADAAATAPAQTEAVAAAEAPPSAKDAAAGSPGDARALALPDLLGGPAAAAPPPPAATPPASVAAAEVAAPATSRTNPEGKPMPLWGREPRLMPMPSRTTQLATRPPPPLAVPKSGSAQRSNVPITGARPTAMAPSPAMVQQMVAAQADAAGPLTPQQAAVSSPAAPTDWFSSAMTQAMDKYERGARVGQSNGQTIAQP